jgi:nucleotide-binding universal stress UspA family protein
MFKDIVVPITATPGDADAINVAIDLAAHFGAHLAVLELVNLPMPMPGPWGLMPDVTMSDLYSRLRAQGEVNVAKRKASLENVAVQAEVRLVESLFAEPARMAAHCAHYADLSVVAGGINVTAEGETAHAYVSALLLESGRPVLVVPPRSRAAQPPRRIALAWRPTAEAARAVNDAMPFLVQAERVDVLIVDPPAGERDDGQQPGADIATHLARHGVRAHVVIHESRGRAVSSILLQHAREMPAHLIVAGGYGHSRLREWVMGGVTRELLVSSPVPLLFSH